MQQSLPQKRKNPNKIKTFANLFYCYSCVYNVDHDGEHCPLPKKHHFTNVSHNKAHEYDGACMKAQNKTLQDGTGVGKLWILAQSISKAHYVINGGEKHGGGRNQYGGRGNGGGK